MSVKSRQELSIGLDSNMPQNDAGIIGIINKACFIWWGSGGNFH